MSTENIQRELAETRAHELALGQTDQVGGGKYVLFVVNGNTYFRDSFSGRIGIEDSASGTSHWL